MPKSENVHDLSCPVLWDEEDLESIDDLPGGKLLLEWLTAQLSDKEDTTRESGVSCSKNDEVSRNAGSIELEADQTLTFVQYNEEVYTREYTPGLTDYPLSFQSAKHQGSQDRSAQRESGFDPAISSSRLKKHAEYVNQEIDFIQREVDSVRLRISMTKAASKEISQTNKLLRSTVFSLDSNIRASDEILSELSINADERISSTLHDAHALLCDVGLPQKDSGHDSFGSNPIEGPQSVELARGFLRNIQNDVSNLTRNFRRYLESYQQLSEAEHRENGKLEKEYERLSTIFRTLSVQSGSEKNPNNSVDALLVQAWAQDQFTILKFHQGFFDNAISSLDATSSPLENLQRSLSSLACCVQNVEATLEALGEELGDIHVNHMPVRGTVDLRKDEELERDLKLLLNNSKALETEPGPLMMVLDRADIFAQLHYLKNKYIGLETQEMIWTDSVLREYMKKPIHADTTLNQSRSSTSPPFDYPADVRLLETRTREETKKLQQLADSVEEEVRETFAKDSNSIRLQSFVDKYSRSNA